MDITISYRYSHCGYYGFLLVVTDTSIFSVIRAVSYCHCYGVLFLFFFFLAARSAAAAVLVVITLRS